MKLQISYKNSVIGSLSAGESIALHLNGQKLTEDLVVRASNLQTITVMTRYEGFAEYTSRTITFGTEIKTWQEFIDSPYNSYELNDGCVFTLLSDNSVYIKVGTATSDGSVFYDDERSVIALSHEEIIPEGVYYAVVNHGGGSN